MFKSKIIKDDQDNTLYFFIMVGRLSGNSLHNHFLKKDYNFKVDCRYLLSLLQLKSNLN